jgi:hypothetical protein
MKRETLAGQREKFGKYSVFKPSELKDPSSQHLEKIIIKVCQLNYYNLICLKKIYDRD